MNIFRVALIALPIVAFGFWVSCIVVPVVVATGVPAVVDAVVPAVADSVLKAL